MRGSGRTWTVAAAIGALGVLAPPAAAAPRAGYRYTGALGRGHAELSVAEGGRAIPEFAFAFRRGRCTDGTAYRGTNDQRLEPSMTISAAGTFRLTYRHTFRGQVDGRARRTRFFFRVVGRFDPAGDVATGTFRQRTRVVGGAQRCDSRPVAFRAHRGGRAPGLTLEIADTEPFIGTPIAATGRYVTGDPGTGRIALLGRQGAAPYRQVATAALTPAGRFSFPGLRPDRITRYRVQATPAAGAPTAHSTSVRVRVFARAKLDLARRGGRLVARDRIVGYHVARAYRAPRLYFYFRKPGAQRYARIGSRPLRRTAAGGFTSTLAAGLIFADKHVGSAIVCTRAAPFPGLAGAVATPGCGGATLKGL